MLKDILDGEIHVSQSTNAKLMNIINDYKEWDALIKLNNIAWGFDCKWEDRDKPEEIARQNQAQEEIDKRLRNAFNKIIK